MRLTIAAVGRLAPGPEKTLCDLYSERIDALKGSVRLGPLAFIEIDPRRGRAASGDVDTRLAAAASRADARIVLDERGAVIDSKTFAARLGAWRDAGLRETAVVIGGADGLNQEIRGSADWVVSFGRMTWPHALARAMAAEQLYRAASILGGRPYHREG